MSPRSNAFKQSIWFAYRAGTFAGVTLRYNPLTRRAEILFVFRSDFAALRFAAWMESGIFASRRDLEVVQLRRADLSPCWCVAVPFVPARRIRQPIGLPFVGNFKNLPSFAATVAAL